jgi:hypothetical protein
MIYRWGLIAVLTLSVGGAAFAQPGPKVLVWNQRSPQAEASFGILGEIARPGVYSSAAAQVTLQELIERAGGLSRRGSPSVRIIHGGRGGQSVFYRPDAHDVLMPGSLVVIDSLRDPRQSLSPAVGDRTDRSVWIAFIGLTDRPEVVPVNPEQAQLPNVMLMLGQSAELAKAVQTIVPPRLPQPPGQFDPIPNGAVLVFDRSLLVTDTLPTFPAAVSLTVPAASTATAAVPLPPATMATPVSEPQLASLPRTQIDAQPVPFTVPRTEDVPASPASLPAPGSRFAPPPPIDIPPAASPALEPPAMTAGPPLIIDTDPQIEAELVGVPGIEPRPAPSGFNPWQLVGVIGSLASLVGVALVSRRYLDRTAASEAELPPAIAERLHRAPPMPPQRSFEPMIAAPADDRDEDELRELLSGRLAIESEAIELPSRLELKAAAVQRRAEPIFRVDEAETPAPHFPIGTPFTQQTTFFTDAAAEAPSVPAPHFRHRKPRTEAATPTAASPAPLITGTSLERALSQLQEGLKS